MLLSQHLHGRRGRTLALSLDPSRPTQTPGREAATPCDLNHHHLITVLTPLALTGVPALTGAPGCTLTATCLPSSVAELTVQNSPGTARRAGQGRLCCAARARAACGAWGEGGGA